MSASVVVTVPLSPSPRDSPEPGRKFLPLKVEGAGPGKRGGGSDDMWARRSQNSPKHGGASPTHFLPVPATTANQPGWTGRAESEADKPRRRPSWLDDELSPTYSHSASVSDDSESMSMIDVRCEEDVFLNPHSQVRHELMHNQYNRLKEEEDHWQDDLARWKSRRRSVSQDLIKKEEERKMMERLMTGDEGPAQRRKSIKTYKEIVQDKERRERELHEAYRRARSPEEAHQVLQRYAQRFSISEAILERLKLPKLLERSISADPTAARLPPLPDFSDVFEPCLDQDSNTGSNGAGSSSGGSSGSNPMQYLRQQSLPAPKFTSTVEAMVGSFAPAATSAAPPPPPPERPSKPVPILAPKPYAPQHRAGEPAGDKPAKVDGMLRVNGETMDKTEGKEGSDQREDSPSPLQFLPCPVTETEEAQEPRVPVSSASPAAPSSSSSSPTRVMQQASPAHAPKQASPTHSPPKASPTHTLKEVSPAHTLNQSSPTHTTPKASPVHTPQQGSPVTHTSEHASPAHTPKQASPTDTPKQASPTHISTQASPSHSPLATTPPSEERTPGSTGRSLVVEEEEVKATEEVQSEETPLVEESQDQVPERQEEEEDDEEELGDERGQPQSQHALQPPESPKETAPSRPTSLPTELQCEPSAPPLEDEEAQSLPFTQAQHGQATEVTTCTTAPSLHTIAPTPVATDPGSVPGQESTAQIGDPVDHLESTHLPPPLSRSPCAPQSTESPAKEHSDVSVSPVVLSMVKRGDQWSWDPDEERRRQEMWQREQERMLQEKYRREQEKLKQEWERAQREVEEEERKFHEEEQKILEETVAPLTPHSPALPASPAPLRGDIVPTASASAPSSTVPHDTIVRSLADWERKQEMLERQARGSTEDWSHRDSEQTDRGTEERSSHLQKAESADLLTSSGLSEASSRSQHNGQRATRGHSQPRSPQPQSSQEMTRNSKQKTTSLDRKTGGRRSEAGENAPSSPMSPPYSSDTPPSSPNRSVSGKKLCSSCGHPLGKGAAMIIETLSLYFHIQCFKCGICKGQLGDTTTGTDVRIRNGLLNCHQCYIRSRSAGQPTTL
ncbi:hypothetical protein ACEWY4_027144 [Coilia grayii]|uniref:LIM zinc-binding domain-containing protein n=1 Tax=Coilia grayii TaxID=363190 RepID=A0ABD1IUJ6_9TELE